MLCMLYILCYIYVYINTYIFNLLIFLLPMRAEVFIWFVTTVSTASRKLLAVQCLVLSRADRQSNANRHLLNQSVLVGDDPSLGFSTIFSGLRHLSQRELWFSSTCSTILQLYNQLLLNADSMPANMSISWLLTHWCGNRVHVE